MVVYLSYAANCDGPLPSRLRIVHQPALRSSLEGIRTSFSPSGLLADTPAPCHLTIVRLSSRLQRLGRRPRRYAEHAHLPPALHPIGQLGRHRRRAGPPLRGCARAIGRDRLRQGLA